MIKLQSHVESLSERLDTYNYTTRRRRSDETLREDQRNVRLLKAAAEGQLPRIRHLLRLGVDIDHSDDQAFTALHHAVLSGFEDCVRELIEAGLDVNERTFDGQTPLDLARAKQRTRVAEILIEARAELGRDDGTREIHSRPIEISANDESHSPAPNPEDLLDADMPDVKVSTEPGSSAPSPNIDAVRSSRDASPLAITRNNQLPETLEEAADMNVLEPSKSVPTSHSVTPNVTSLDMVAHVSPHGPVEVANLRPEQQRQSPTPRESYDVRRSDAGLLTRHFLTAAALRQHDREAGHHQRRKRRSRRMYTGEPIQDPKDNEATTSTPITERSRDDSTPGALKSTDDLAIYNRVPPIATSHDSEFVSRSLKTVRVPIEIEYGLRDAVYYDDVNAARKFLRQGANPLSHKLGSESSAENAARLDKASLFEAMLDHGLIERLRASEGASRRLFEEACVPIARALLARDSEYTTRCPYLLHAAASEGDLEKVKLLVKAGMSLSARNRNDRTPLEEAESAQRENVIHYLTPHSPSAFPSSGTSLHVSKHAGGLKVVLYRNGHDPRVVLSRSDAEHKNMRKASRPSAHRESSRVRAIDEDGSPLPEDGADRGAGPSLSNPIPPPDQRPYRSGTSAASRMTNNPKLQEMVEDTIKRIILPEMNAIKEKEKNDRKLLKFEDQRESSNGENRGREFQASS